MLKGGLLIASLWLALPASAQYRIEGEVSDGHLPLSLQLPTQRSEDLRLMARGTGWGLTSQVTAVRCDDQPLERDGDAWRVSPWCERVHWQVQLDPLGPGGADANAQRSLLIGEPAWVLLAEPTALLRIEGNSEPSRLEWSAKPTHLLGATPAGRGWLVPPSSHAPEFYVIGAPSSRTSLPIGSLQVTHVADDPARFQALDLAQLHASALDYLAAVVSPTGASSMLLVIWLGVPAEKGHAGGAAGHRSFVANYVFGDPAQAQLNAARTLTITAHEQFHQLVDGSRSAGVNWPTWLNESLAHYYGLKALRRAVPADQAAPILTSFIDPDAPIEEGLLSLQRRFNAGDRSVYPRFYSQGATFWSALDEAIAAASEGKRSLDDHLPILLRSATPATGGLPEALVEVWRADLDDSLDPLLARYLGQ